MNHQAPCHCYPIMTALLVAFLVTNLHVCDAAVDGDATKPTAATELSVAPSSHQEFPEERPAWVDEAPSLDGDVHRWAVTSSPCSTESLCHEGLKVSMRAAVETYIESITGDASGSEVVKVSDDWIEDRRDPSKRYLGTVKSGDEVMYEAATVLVFDAHDQKMIMKMWRQNQVGQRLAVLGLLSGGVVSVFVGIAATLSMVTRRAEQRVSP
jgi:hypothetical protein